MRSKTILSEFVLWCCFSIAGLVCSTAAAATCQPSDIALDQLKSRVGRSHSYIVGRVSNNCDLETGVHIKIVILDHAGGVLRVADFWPASNDNIPAHSGFPFQTMVEGVALFDRFQVTVIEVKRWAE